MKKLPKTIRYEVTAAHIGCADACTTNCPHARAIKEKTGSNRVRVYGGRVSIAWGGRRYYYSAPTYTQKFEGAYDTTGDVSPGIAVIRWFADYPISPIPQERKDQINTARAIRTQTIRAQGNSPKTYDGRVFTA